MSHNRRKIVKPRLPPEDIAYALIRSDDASRIALPPRRIFHHEIDSRHALDRIDHPANRKTVTIAAIERQWRPTCAQVAQCQRVRSGKVADVNVIADASAVRGWIIGAEDFELRAQSPTRFPPPP